MAKKFIRKDAHKKTRVGTGWRKPKGIQNKKRLQRKGNATKVKPGFGTKTTEKNTTRQGLKIITITTTEELKNINPKTQAIIISKTGKKKKLEIIAEAEKAKITITNFNAARYKENAQKQQEQKEETSKERKKKLEEKARTEKAAEKKKEDKKTETTELSDEEKKKHEKEEKDKVLTKAK